MNLKSTLAPLLMASLVVAPQWVQAVPTAIPYFGLLTYDSGAPVHAALSVEIRMFSVDVGGSPVWAYDYGTTEIHDGLLSAVLGGPGQPDVDAVVASHPSLWVEVVVGGAVLTPRQRVYSVPFALRSGDAEALGGLSASGYATQADLAAEPAKATRASTAPPNPADGQLWYDTAESSLKLWDSAAMLWIAVGGSSGGGGGSIQTYASCKAVDEAGLASDFYWVIASGLGAGVTYCDTVNNWEIRTDPINQDLAGNRTFCSSRGMFLAVPDASEIPSMTAALDTAFAGSTVWVRTDLAVRLSGSCSGPLSAQSNSGAAESVSAFVLPGTTQCSANSGSTYIQGAQLRHSSGTFYSAVGSGNHGGNNQTGWTNVCVQANNSACTSFAPASTGPHTICEW